MRRPITRAHPRSRGENPLTGRCPASGVGSSPLTRGKRPLVESPAQPGGLIPAHAGKTVRSAAVLVLIRAHPRSRGENTGTPSPNGLLDGSSPLTRGKLDELGVVAAHAGLIPAHAGKTDLAAAPRTGKRAHPRSRGENEGRAVNALYVWGSSPLTRGKRQGDFPLSEPLGLIPAHAGKTYAISGLLPVVRAHPRSRGENSAPNLRLSFPAGSSPLTRGKRWRRRRSAGSRRLIPAHAGKTTSTTRIPSWAWAHPRSRGENMHRKIDHTRVSGSSPLTRGKQ